MSEPGAPIGIFDSGVGGLTVARAVALRLPRETLVYLGDTARVPYGGKSPATVIHYTRQALAFFEHMRVKLVVIACNTASAAALPTLVREAKLPLVGVVEPGARAAVDKTKTGVIGVIGTRTTVASGSYEEAIHRLRPDATVHSRPCPLFVPLAEEGWLTGPVPRWVAQSYLEPLSATGVDTLVLGCTHYPLLKDVIAQAVGEAVTLVDSAEETARAVEELLDANGLANYSGTGGGHAFHATDVSDTFLAIAQNFFAGPVGELKIVDLESFS
jgi:glutamate racemase